VRAAIFGRRLESPVNPAFETAEITLCFASMVSNFLLQLTKTLRAEQLKDKCWSTAEGVLWHGRATPPNRSYVGEKMTLAADGKGDFHHGNQIVNDD